MQIGVVRARVGRVTVGALQNASATASTSSVRSLSTSRAAMNSQQAKPRRPNPYRLPTLPVFLGAFAPLHAAGWRLESIPGRGVGATSHNASTDILSGADLQSRRLTRACAFPPNRDGWRALTRLVAAAGEAVEAEDHHPSMTIAPMSDLPPSMSAIVANPDSAGYVLHVSTHTHTPLPPLGAEGVVFDGKPRPGVTYKDLKLAERIEALIAEAGGEGDR